MKQNRETGTWEINSGKTSILLFVLPWGSSLLSFLFCMVSKLFLILWKYSHPWLRPSGLMDFSVLQSHCGPREAGASSGSQGTTAFSVATHPKASPTGQGWQWWLSWSWHCTATLVLSCPLHSEWSAQGKSKVLQPLIFIVSPVSATLTSEDIPCSSRFMPKIPCSFFFSPQETQQLFLAPEYLARAWTLIFQHRLINISTGEENNDLY